MYDLHIEYNSMASGQLRVISSPDKLFAGWFEVFTTHGLTIKFNVDTSNTEMISRTLFTCQPRHGVFYFRHNFDGKYTYHEADLRNMYLRNYYDETQYVEDTLIGRQYIYNLRYYLLTRDDFYTAIGTENPDENFLDLEVEEATTYLASLGLAFVED